VAVAVAKAGGGGDGGVGVLLRRSEGFGHSLSSREAGGHRGGEGAACAVRVRRVDTRAVEPVEGLTIAYVCAGAKLHHLSGVVLSSAGGVKIPRH